MSAKKFLTELFDANFNRFIITSLAKVLYVLGLIATTGVTSAFALGGLGALAISDDPVVRILVPFLVLTGAGVLFLLGALLCRVACESIMVVYHIASNTTRLVELGERARAERTLPSPVDERRAVPAVA